MSTVSKKSLVIFVSPSAMNFSFSFKSAHMCIIHACNSSSMLCSTEVALHPCHLDTMWTKSAASHQNLPGFMCISTWQKRWHNFEIQWSRVESLCFMGWTAFFLSSTHAAILFPVGVQQLYHSIPSCLSAASRYARHLL